MRWRRKGAAFGEVVARGAGLFPVLMVNAAITESVRQLRILGHEVSPLQLLTDAEAVFVGHGYDALPRGLHDGLADIYVWADEITERWLDGRG